MIGDWVKQGTATTGTGNITLGAAFPGYVGVADQFADGDEVYYTLLDGANKESGLGTFTATGGILSRDTVFETLVSGVFDNTSPAAMSLSGNAVVTITASTFGLLRHKPVWKDNLGSISAASKGPSAPTNTAFVGGLTGYMFANAATEEAETTLHINHDYCPGRAYYMHIHWSPETAAAGVVRWGVEVAQAARDTGAFTTTQTVYVEQAANGLRQHQVAEVGDIDAIVPPTPEIDSVVKVRIFRDGTHANDTYPDGAFGHFVDMHYLACYTGTPNKVHDFYQW